MSSSSLGASIPAGEATGPGSVGSNDAVLRVRDFSRLQDIGQVCSFEKSRVLLSVALDESSAMLESGSRPQTYPTRKVKKKIY